MVHGILLLFSLSCMEDKCFLANKNKGFLEGNEKGYTIFNSKCLIFFYRKYVAVVVYCIYIMEIY